MLETSWLLLQTKAWHAHLHSGVSNTELGFDHKDYSTVPSANASSCTALPFKVMFFSCLRLWRAPSSTTLLLSSPVKIPCILADVILLAVLSFSWVRNYQSMSTKYPKIQGTQKPQYGNTKMFLNILFFCSSCLYLPLQRVMPKSTSMLFEIVYTIYVEKWD